MKYSEKNKYLEVLERMLRLTDEYTGLINHVSTTNRFEYYSGNFAGEFDGFYCTLSNSRLGVKSDTDNSTNGGGLSLSLHRSMVKALGETIERYCAQRNDGKSFVYSSQKEFEKGNINYLSTDLLTRCNDAIYDDPQNNLQRIDKDDSLYWVEGYDLIKDEKIYIPAQSVFIYYPMNNEKIFDDYISTGLACGDGYKNAVVSSIFEAIERDSFYITWMAQKSHTSIRFDRSDNELLNELYHRLYSIFGDKLKIHDISMLEGFYTFCCHISDSDGPIGLAVATATHVSPEICLLKALEELVMTYQHVLDLSMKEDYNPNMIASDIKDLDDHVMYYINNNRAHCFSFLDDLNLNHKMFSSMNNFCEDNNQILDYCVAKLKDVDCSLYVVDLTIPIVQAEGFSVTCAIIPELEDINVAYNSRYVNGKRLKMNIGKNGINPLPHPFP